jgi:hypothetical protein
MLYFCFSDPWRYGPFLESKEAIAGYILLQVGDLNEAVEIAKERPGLEYGVSIEVRAGGT